MAFRRGIGQDFIDALNAEYEKGEANWWHQMVADPECFTAIRDGYLNVYYRGCSLVELRHQEGKLKGLTHYKYLLAPRREPLYLKLTDGELGFDGQTNFSHYALTSYGDLNDLKVAASSYAGFEKTGVHEILTSNENIVDVEVALTQERAGGDHSDGLEINAYASNEQDPSQVVRIRFTPRVDFCALVRSGDQIQLRFYEAKHFSNSELRATDKPAVIGQLDEYADVLRTSEALVTYAYRTVCIELCALTGNNVSDEIKSVARGQPFRVEFAPKLLVFGFDQDQKTGKVWNKHLDKLQKTVKGGVLTKGSPKGFVLT
ncbi:MAG: hypothetical protein HY342_10800 [Candidatus Lambdaproteobacteria bacterium]|nr:hypothetical protein [Candidatus Lambdaproteobacteria bacterium]